MKKRLLVLGVLAMLAQPVLAWRPSGWIYVNWPYAYDHATQAWHWFGSNNVQWINRLASADGWRRLNNTAVAQGWSWHMWPYVYDHDNAAWYNFSAPRNHWCVKLGVDAWSVFGLPPAPAGMAVIPGGTNAGTDPDFGDYSLSVNAFFMDQYEVTKSLWSAVRTWGETRGYTGLTPGTAKATNHPVMAMDWYEAVTWCNARSQRDGRTPVYYTDVGRTNVYKTGQIIPHILNSANGYRLPSDIEWRYAARGGAADRRFPWDLSDTIRHARANYVSLDTIAYDTSPTRGYHPAYEVGDIPYTSPVGSFAPNGYGLYDLAGNAEEWCYDWHPSYVGSQRILHGGSWRANAYFCRIDYIWPFEPTSYFYTVGFRCAAGPGGP